MRCACAEALGLPPSCLEQAGFAQQASVVVLARRRGTGRAEDLSLLGPAEEAKSRTPWHCCKRRCCLPGQVQEAFYSVLDVAELPPGSEDNKELSGHLSGNALQHAALLLFFLLPSPEWFQCTRF